MEEKTKNFRMGSDETQFYFFTTADGNLEEPAIVLFFVELPMVYDVLETGEESAWMFPAMDADLSKPGWVAEDSMERTGVVAEQNGDWLLFKEDTGLRIAQEDVEEFKSLLMKARLE